MFGKTAFGGGSSPFGGGGGSTSFGGGGTSFGGGATTPAPTFGGGGGGAFGSVSTPSFGAANTFGAAAPTNNASTSFSFGGGAATTPGGGGFGGGGGAFGAKPAFGATGGSTFGGGAAASPFGGAATTASPFGGTSTSTFGATTNTGGGGLFGSSTPPSTGGMFGGTNASTSFGGAAATGGAFGSTTSSGFGGFGGGNAARSGTGNPPYKITNDKDTTRGGGVLAYLAISMMPEYKAKSFEELRFEDMKKQQQGGGAGLGGQPAAAGAFGGFGTGNQQNNSATTSLFGGASTPAATPAFGAPAATNAFGTPAAANSSPFGATTTASPFGATATTPSFGGGGLSTGSPFGATTPSTFGSTTSAFAKPATASPFGATASPFGATTGTAGAFGTPAASPGAFGGFGAATASPFGAAAAKPAAGAFSFNTGAATPAATTGTPSFSFGGGSTTPALGGGTTLFGGGAAAAKPASGGFSFGGTPAATTMPAAGGFSFGGSTTPLASTNAFSMPTSATSAAAPFSFATPTAAATTPGGYSFASTLGAQPATPTAVQPLTAAIAMPSYGAVPSFPPLSDTSSTSSATSTAANKPVRPPHFKLTPRSAAKVKPRGYGRSRLSLFDGHADGQALSPDVFVARQNIKRLVIEPTVPGEFDTPPSNNNRPRSGEANRSPSTHQRTTESSRPPSAAATPTSRLSSPGRSRGKNTPISSPQQTQSAPPASSADDPRLVRPTPRALRNGQVNVSADDMPHTNEKGYSPPNRGSYRSYPEFYEDVRPRGANDSSFADDTGVDTFNRSAVGPDDTYIVPPAATATPKAHHRGARDAGSANSTINNDGDDDDDEDDDDRQRHHGSNEVGARSRWREATAPHKLAPNLTHRDYYTVPALDELHAMSEEELAAVTDFVVGRHEVGHVRFLGTTDLRRLRLDDIVVFNHKEINVYPKDFDKPPVGQGLNKPAVVTLFNCFPRRARSPTRIERYAERIRNLTEDMDAEFLGYDQVNGEWTFKVHHFSRYGLDDSDDEEDEEEEDELIGGAAQGRRVGAAAPPVGAVRRVPTQTTAAAAAPISGEMTRNDTSVEDEEMLPYGGDLMDDGSVSGDLRHSPAYTGRPLPAQLGLNASKMQVMKGFLFDNSRADAADAKIGDRRSAFHSRPPSATSKKQRTAEPTSSYDLVAVAAAPAAHKAQPIPSQRLIPADKVPLYVTPESQSVAKDLSKAGHRDAGLFMGRSFRVGWGPGGVLVHSGRPIRMTSTETVRSSDDKSTSTDDDSNRRPSEMGLVHVQRVNVNHSYDAGTMRRVWIKPLEDHLKQSLPEPSAFSMAPVFHLQDPIGHVSTSIDNLQALLPSAVEQGDAMNVSSTSSDHDGPDDDDTKATSAALVLHSDHTTTKSSSTSSYRSTSVTALRHACEIWSLIDALWSPERGGTSAHLFGPGHAADDDDFGNDRARFDERLARRSTLTEWLQTSVSSALDGDLARFGDVEERALEKAFAYLTGMRVAEAVKTAASSGDLRLSTLVAQAGGDDIRDDMSMQLALWEESGAGEFVSEQHRRIYRLLSGDVSTHGVASNLEWLRCFALHLWYGTASNSSLNSAVSRFDVAWRKKEAAPPFPPYIETRRGRRCDESNNYLFADGVRPHYDIVFHLLHLYGDRSYPLWPLLHPNAITPHVLDYRLSWHVYTVLTALRFPVLVPQFAHTLAMGYASQLEFADHPEWAVYVLMHLPDSIASPLVRERAIREIISRSIHLLAGTEREEFLVDTLQVPRAWLDEAKAWLAHYQRRYTREAELYLRCGRWEEAHRVILSEVAPKFIIQQRNKKLHRLLSALEPHASVVPGWDVGGRMYLDYLRVLVAEDVLLRKERNDGQGAEVLRQALHDLDFQVESVCERISERAASPDGRQHHEPLSTTEEVCLAEMSSRLSVYLVRVKQALHALDDASSSSAASLVPHLTSLPLPWDYRRKLTNMMLISV